MRDVPKVPLGDLLESSQNGLSKRRGDGEPVRVLRLADVVNGQVDESDPREINLSSKEIEKYQLQRGDLVCVRVNGSPSLVGRLVPFQSATRWAYCDHFIRFRPKGDVVDTRYLNHYFSTQLVRRHVELNMVSSAGQNTVSQGTMLGIPVPLPTLDEQRRIVAEIDKQFSRLDEAVANLQRVKANLKRYKAAVLKAAVEGRLVETEASIARREGRDYETGEQLLQRIVEERGAEWRGKRKYRDPGNPETSELSELPAGWRWASPDQLSAGEPYSLAIGPFGSSLKVSDYKTEGVPLVFVRNIRSGSFGGENTAYVTTEKAAELSAHSVEAGDILVTKMGDPPGDVCRYPASCPPAVITADCIKLRVTKIGVDPGFLEYAIASRIVQDQILGITKGVAQLKVNLANFSSIALPLPPYPEQVRIVAEVDRRLSIIREVEAEVITNLQRSNALRQSILKGAFED